MLPELWHLSTRVGSVHDEVDTSPQVPVAFGFVRCELLGAGGAGLSIRMPEQHSDTKNLNLAKRR